MDKFSKRAISQKICQKLAGFICLLIVILVTVGSSIFIKSLESDFKKPFTLTYYNYNFLIILIGVYYLKEKIKSWFRKGKENVQVDEHETDIDLIRESTQEENFSEAFKKVKKDKKIEFNEFQNHIIMSLTLLWYFANSFYNLGLMYVPISFGNTLSNLAFLFIFIEKFVCFKRNCSVYKSVASCIGIAGLVLITVNQLADADDDVTIFSSKAILGDFFILLGALFYSLYSVLIKFFSKRYGDEFDMMLIFGFMGLYNFLMMPIFLFAMSVFGGESFEFPGFSTLWKIFLNALVAGIGSDLLQSYAIILLSPHIVSFGLTLTIPLSICWDYIYVEDNDIKFDTFFFFGTSLVFLSFLVVVYESYRKIQLKKKHVEKHDINKLVSDPTECTSISLNTPFHKTL